MVASELPVQEADERGLEATEEERTAALEQLAAGSQLSSADEVLAAFEEQGMDKDEVFSQLDTQVKLEKLIADEVGTAEPTKEELRQIYDQAAAQQGQVPCSGVARCPSM